MALSLVTAPQVEPLTLVEARTHLRDPDPKEDALIAGLIAAARERAETVTGRQLMQATWDLRLDQFPCNDEIRIPKPPLVSVTYVKYVDTTGSLQTVDPATYQIDAPVGPIAGRGRLQPAYATSWPASRVDTYNAVLVRFIAGYGTAGASVPQPIRQAMLLMLSAWFERRDDLALSATGEAAPLGALALLTPYKLFGA